MTGAARPMTSGELAYWEEFHRLEPAGDEYRRDARTQAAIYFAGGVKKVGGGEFSEDDFMPFRKSIEQSQEDIKRTLTASLGRPQTKQ